MLCEISKHRQIEFRQFLSKTFADLMLWGDSVGNTLVWGMSLSPGFSTRTLAGNKETGGHGGPFINGSGRDATTYKTG